MQDRNIDLKNVLILFIFFSLGIFIFTPGLFGPFLLDDLASIFPTKIDTFDFNTFINIVLDNKTGPIGRPIAIASFALNHLWVGSTAFDFKFINLLIHILNATLMLLISKKIFETISIPQKSITFFTLLVSFIWFVHPVQISTVHYPVQRMVLLSCFFTSCGILSYFKARQLQEQNSSSSTLYFCITFLVFYPLAILSKETGILLPFYLALIEGIILKYQNLNGRQEKILRNTHFYICSSLILGALLYFSIHINGIMADYAEKDYSLPTRLLTQVHALIFYLKQSFAPQLSKLGFYHDDFPLTTNLNLVTFLGMCFLTFLVSLVWFCRHKTPLISLGLGFFFTSHMIESSILPLEVVFEHRNYFSLLGILFTFVGIILFVYPFISSKLIKNLCKYVLFVYVFSICGLSFARNTTWSSTESFLHHAYLHHTDSARVHIEMANYLLNHRSYYFALQELQRAQNIQPYNAGIALHALLIFCHAQEAPDQLYQNVENLIKKTELNAYVIMVLDAIVNNLLHQQCMGVDAKKIENIVQNFYEHPFIQYKPLHHAMLLHLEAALKLMQGNTSQGHLLLMQSFEKYPKRYHALEEKVVLEKKLNLDSDLEKSLKLLKKHHPHRFNEIKRLYEN